MTPRLRRRFILSLERLEDRYAPATAIWTGAGATDNWSDPGNWQGNVAPAVGDDLVFPTVVPANQANFNDFLAGTSFRSISLSGQGYTLDGNVLVLTDGLSARNGAGGNTIDLVVGLNGDQTLDVQSLAATLTFTAGVDFGGSVLNVIGKGNVTFAAALTGQGPAALIKNGLGQASLTADNSDFAGEVQVQAGVLRITDANALGDTTGDTFVSGTGTLRIDAALTLAEALNLSGGGFAGNGAVQTAFDVTLNGSIETSGSVTLNVADAAATLTVASAVTEQGSSSLVKEGFGTLRFEEAAGFSATTTINGGTLLLIDNGALSSSTVRVNPGASLTLDNGAMTANRLADGAQLVLEAGRLSFLGQVGASVSETIGILNLAGGHNIVDLGSDASMGSSLQLNAASLQRSAGATVQFNPGAVPLGDPDNRILFTTPPTLSGGVLPYAFVELGQPNHVFATYGANGITASAPAAFVDGTNDATVIARMTNDTVVAANTTIGSLVVTNNQDGPIIVTINPGVTLTLASGALLTTAENIDIQFTGGGTLRLQSPTFQEAFLFSYTGGDTIITNAITSDNLLVNGLTLSGPSNVQFDGAAPNSYLGPTRVNAGALFLNKNANTLAIPGDLMVGDGSGSESVQVNQVGQLVAAVPGAAPTTDPDFGTTTNPNFLLPGTYGLVYTFLTQNGGETVASPRETFTVPVNMGGDPYVPLGTVPALPPGVFAFNVYMTQVDDENGALFFYKTETGTFVYDLTTSVPPFGAAPPTQSTAFADVTVLGGGILAFLADATIRHLTLKGTNGSAVVNSNEATLTVVGNVTVQQPTVTAEQFAGQALIEGNLELAATTAQHAFIIADGAAVNDAVIRAMISGTAAGIGLAKHGAGTLLLTADNSYDGDTVIHEGSVVVNGNPLGNASAFHVDFFGSLRGGLTTTAATTGDTIVDGTLSPGQLPGADQRAGSPNAGAGTRGILAAHSLSLTGSSTLVLEVAGFTTPGDDFDQVQSAGALTIDPNATLVIDLSNLGIPAGPGVATVATFASRVGQFHQVQFINPNNLAVSVQYLATAINIHVFPSQVPAPLNIIVTARGGRPGGKIRVFDAQTQQLLYRITPFNNRAPVQLALGDITGDGITDIIVSAAGRIRSFDGLTGQRISTAIGNFRPFGAGYTGQVFIAVGDLDNDGTGDIIAGKATGPGLIRAWSSVGFDVNNRLANFKAFPGTSGGVRVAAGQSGLGGPGQEIYAVNGAGATTEVRIFDTNGAQLNGAPILPYGASKKGAFLAVGDLDLDGFADIVLGPGKLSANRPVRVIDGETLSVNPNLDFNPFPGQSGPVQVGLTDADGDGRLDVVAALGNQGSEVTAWDMNAPGGPVIFMPLESFNAYANFNKGIRLSASSRT